LDRQRFPAKVKDEMAFGIERLVAENVYCAAYPLHDVSSNNNHNFLGVLNHIYQSSG